MKATTTPARDRTSPATTTTVASATMATTATIASPIGRLVLVASNEALTELRFDPHGPFAGGKDARARSHGDAAREEHRSDEVPTAPTQASAAGGSGAQDLLLRACRQLDEYFRGERTDFDLPLAPRGTEFQCAVWRALLQIPFGETWSYQKLARALGRPDAMRAVGAANGQNPLPIVIPCHRVIGADGSLTGYGGGLALKQWLLKHEAKRKQPLLPAIGTPVGAGAPSASGEMRHPSDEPEPEAGGANR
jgi:methylated-DNA-[protein]-cysteine S-methyltransferase